MALVRVVQPFFLLGFAVLGAFALACGGTSDGDRGEANGGSSGAPGGTGSGTSGGGAGTGGDAGSSGSGGANASGGSSGATNPLDCDHRKITCRRAEPECPEMQVPRVDGSCYGECVPIAECGCAAAEDCPHEETYTCHRSAMRCGPYLQ